MKQRVSIESTAYTKRGMKICDAVNSYEKSHPQQKQMSIKSGMSDERVYLHSEILCLIRATRLGKKIDTLKVERYGKNGRTLTAFPCPSCQFAIKEAGVKKVIFTTEEGFKTWIV